jgi:hypothetical protein
MTTRDRLRRRFQALERAATLAARTAGRLEERADRAWAALVQYDRTRKIVAQATARRAR